MFLWLFQSIRFLLILQIKWNFGRLQPSESRNREGHQQNQGSSSEIRSRYKVRKSNFSQENTLSYAISGVIIRYHDISGEIGRCRKKSCLSGRLLISSGRSRELTVEIGRLPIKSGWLEHMFWRTQTLPITSTLILTLNPKPNPNITNPDPNTNTTSIH